MECSDDEIKNDTINACDELNRMSMDRYMKVWNRIQHSMYESVVIVTVEIKIDIVGISSDIVWIRIEIRCMNQDRGCMKVGVRCIQ